MNERLEIMEKRYDELTELLQDPSVVTNVKLLTEYAKEQKQLEKTVMLYRELKNLESSLDDLQELKKADDEEMALLAEEELANAHNRINEINEEIKVLLLPKDPNDDKNVIMEIKGAVGGDEANIFAGDLYRMYSKYAENMGWKIEVLDALYGAVGGYTSINFMVKGESVYSHLKYESGGHRVQRVPQTESQGRIHTSIATVLALPEAADIEFELDMNDIRVDTFCSSGPGGQGVNTTYSAVRVTHIPTGVAVACQIHRSQHENKAAALQLLKARIYDKMLEEKEAKEGQERKSLVGHGKRSEKIRTYNYPQNRVTDHRIGFSINRLDAIMDGKLELVIDELINADQKQKLEEEAH